MKALIFAITTSISVMLLVGANSFMLNRTLSSLIEECEAIPDETNMKAEYEELYQSFMKKQKFISLTVSHDDLTEIENDLAEIIGATLADDRDTLIIAKSRLVMTLTHLRRLSGVNLDSIL